MTASHPKRPRDPNQLAKSIIDIAGEEPEQNAPAGAVLIRTLVLIN